MSEESKKRFRITLVCSYCKKRKVKCDKGKPCSACVKYSIGHLCSYTENPWSDPASELKGTTPSFTVTQSDRNISSGPLGAAKISTLASVASGVSTFRATSVPPPAIPSKVSVHNQPKYSYSVNQPVVEKTSFQVYKGVPNQADVQANILSNFQPDSYPNAPLSGYATTRIREHPQPKSHAHNKVYSTGNPNVQLDPQPLQPPLIVQQPSPTPIMDAVVAPDPLKGAGLTGNDRINATFSLPNKTVNKNGSAVQSELEILKDRIRQIEASITLSHLPPAARSATSSAVSTPLAYSPRNSVSSQVNVGNAPSPQSNSMAHDYRPSIPVDRHSTLPPRDNSNKIQLPPLNWFSPRGASDLKPLPTASSVSYIGINPYESEHDSMNFYEGYSSIHVRDSFRRVNYGPFSWLSLMKKDECMFLMWAHALHPTIYKPRQVMQLSGIYPPSKQTKEASDEPGDPKKSILDEQSREVPNATISNVTASTSNTPPDEGTSPSLVIGFEEDESGQLRKKFKCDHETRFREKALERDGYGNIRPYNKLRRSKLSELDLKDTSSVNGNSVDISKEAGPKDNSSNYLSSNSTITRIQNMNKNTISLGLTLFEGKIDKELQLIEKIHMVLPERKTIWLLVSRFFKDVYPYLPIIDEVDFKQNIERIIGSATTSKDSELIVEKRLDFSYLGTLLIMIRFTYLSLFSNRTGLNEQRLNSTDSTIESQEVKFLLSNPINIDIIDMAQLCIDQFLFLQESNLLVMQSLLFMRLYKKFAPEEGDGVDGGDSRIGTGVLVQMAYLVGINREPDYFLDVCNNERENNIGRKIWNTLVSIDIVQSFSYGNPLNIEPKYYDTKLPYFKEGNQNILDIELEKHIINGSNYLGSFIPIVRELLDMTLSIHGQVNIKILTSKISEFENELSSCLGQLCDLLTPFDKSKYYAPFEKTNFCRRLLILKYFNLSLLMHVYFEFERKGNKRLSYFYMRKLMAISCDELMPYYLNLIWDMHINFGDVSTLFLSPTIIETIHKANQINFMIIIRLNFTISQMKYNPNHESLMASNFNYALKFKKLCKLSSNMEKCTELCISAIDKLKSRYYYAWRTVKSHAFFLRKIYEDDVYKRITRGKFQVLEITVDEINDLISFTEAAVTKYKKTTMYRDLEEKKRADRKQEAKRKLNETDNSKNSYSYGEQIDESNYNQYTHLLDVMSNEPLHTSDSITSVSDFDEVVDNAAIDHLWYQIASKKNLGTKTSNKTNQLNSTGNLNGNPNNSSQNFNNVAGINGNNMAANDESNPLHHIDPSANQTGEPNTTSNGVNGFEYQPFGQFFNTPQIEDPFLFLNDIDLYPADFLDFAGVSNQ